MIGAGLFGKIPTSGDFVSAGSISENRRTFERWLQMSNDRAAELRRPLPAGPLGFLFKGEDPSSVLCGVLRGSRDRVGRKFPLALFCEVATEPNVPIHALPGALAPQFVEFAQLVRAAIEGTEPSVVDALGRIPLPTSELLMARARRESERLSSIAAPQLLDRMFVSLQERTFGFEVLVRACSTLARRSTRRPLVLVGKAAVDVDLLFWLGCLDAAFRPETPWSSIWIPSAQRIFLILGVPDSNVLQLIEDPMAESDRLWPFWPSDPERLALRASTLPEDYLTRLAHPGSSSGREIISATKEVVDAQRRAYDRPTSSAD